jgi:phosphoglycerate dehydrogenase-like enzyme
VWIGRLPDGVVLCDGRGVHDAPVAEWVVGVAVASRRRFPAFARAQEREDWAFDRYTPTPELTGSRVLIVGAGSIGHAIERHLAPFEVTVTRVARTARPDEDVHGVDDLPALLPHADVVVLVVPLTDATRGLVDAAFLAAMPDGALLVDTGALVAELAGGRIWAALDVTDPEPLPVGHPLWKLPNVFITPHIGGTVQGLLPRAYRLAGDQLRRFVAGEPLINQVLGDY